MSRAGRIQAILRRLAKTMSQLEEMWNKREANDEDKSNK